MPRSCPVCGGHIVREEGESASRCVNTNCPARLRESLLHFASRSSMDIEGMGDALVDQLLQRGLIHNVADLYSLTASQLSELERMGEKSAAKVVRNVDRSRAQPLPRVLNGLGIPFVGERTPRFSPDTLAASTRLPAHPRRNYKPRKKSAQKSPIRSASSSRNPAIAS